MPPKKKRLPGQVANTKSTKRLPDQSGDISPDQMSPLWSFAALDVGSPWCWSQMTSEQSRDVHRRLGNFESMTWATIKASTGSHNANTAELSKEARDRLEELGMDDLEQLFSLRISGPQRIWGILDNNILRILWWDPNHAVYPSKLKHT